MTTVYILIQYVEGISIDILGVYLNPSSAYKVLEKIYQDKVNDALARASRGEQLPAWVNDTSLLAQPDMNITPQPLYQLFFGEDEINYAIFQMPVQQ